MEYVDMIFFRKVNPSDFKNLYDIDRPTTGGGQTYLEAAGISYEDLSTFLSKGELSDSPRVDETRHIYTINAYVLGSADGQSQKLEFDPRSGRNNYKISRQTLREKHPAWSVENGFPEAPQDTNGQYMQIDNFSGIIDNLVIIIIRTTYNKYYASYINTHEIPSSWPSDIGLELMFEGDRRGFCGYRLTWFHLSTTKTIHSVNPPVNLNGLRAEKRSSLRCPWCGKSYTIGGNIVMMNPD